MRTIRDYYLAHIRKRFPRFRPRHDFDILALGDGRFKGTEKEVYAWLDKELAVQVAMSGDARPALEAATRMLSTKGTVTGVSICVAYFFLVALTSAQWKPSHGDAGVFIRPIPGTAYSFRLFPGSPSLREYCLDFIKTATGVPVNSPFEFELWSVGPSSSPHPHRPLRLRSLECSWGYLQKDIAPGAEKFVLRDGMTCVLKRPGLRSLRFTVPTRSMQAPDTSDMDDIDLPRHAV